MYLSSRIVKYNKQTKTLFLYAQLMVVTYLLKLQLFFTKILLDTKSQQHTRQTDIEVEIVLKHESVDQIYFA